MSNTAPPGIWPALRSADAPTLIDFLVDAFGFVETARHGEGSTVDHAELAWPLGGGVMLGSVREGDDEWAVQPGTAGCYVVTDDVDSLFARATGLGASVMYGPRDTPYGSRECGLRDVEGNRWSFGTYRGAPVP